MYSINTKIKHLKKFDMGTVLDMIGYAYATIALLTFGAIFVGMLLSAFQKEKKEEDL